jgi:UDP-N-acetylglucosamine 2-epimerase
MLKIITVVGARPQFIKAAIVTRAIQQHNVYGSEPEITEVLVHTGQHYDDNMSRIFFEQLDIPVAHVEAGLRSFNRRMPEEINRVLTDQISDTLFCPTDTAMSNLKQEGVTDGGLNVGDVMYDAFIEYQKMARDKSTILLDLAIQSTEYCLATVHRRTLNPKP